MRSSHILVWPRNEERIQFEERTLTHIIILGKNQRRIKEEGRKKDGEREAGEGRGGGILKKNELTDYNN